MKCVIPGINLKVFGRAIHSLSKIGDELYFEPLEEGLALRTVNSSRSAFACFLFSPSFFQHYNDGTSIDNSEDSEEETFRCKLAMKSILTVFRSLYTIEKTVERCKIGLDAPESRLVFQLHCKHGIVKTHNLAFIECETLQAVFSKDLCPNALTAPPKLLCDVVVNFQHNQEEITLIVNPNKVALKNYTEDEPDPAKVVHTELTLTPDEFDNFQIGVDAEITFCLKELRAILAFVEVTNLNLNINFETPGRPVVFSVDSDQTFEASFVLATLAEHEAGMTQTQTRGKKQSQTRHNNSKRTQSNKSRRNQSQNLHTQESASTSRLTNGGFKDRSRNVTTTDVEPSHTSAMEESVSIDDATVSRLPMETDDLSQGDNQSRPEEPAQSRSHAPSGSRSPKPTNSGDNQSMESPVIPVILDNPKESPGTTRPAECVLQDLDEEEEDDEVLPGTPPSKKFRSLFFGLSQSQASQSQAPANKSNVLAEDTDEDD